MLGPNGNIVPKPPNLWQVSTNNKNTKTLKSHSSAYIVASLMGPHLFPAFTHQLITQTHASLSVFSYKVKAHSITCSGLGKTRLFLVHLEAVLACA